MCFPFDARKMNNWVRKTHIGKGKMEGNRCIVLARTIPVISDFLKTWFCLSISILKQYTSWVHKMSKGWGRNSQEGSREAQTNIVGLVLHTKLKPSACGICVDQVFTSMAVLLSSFSTPYKSYYLIHPSFTPLTALKYHLTVFIHIDCLPK